MAMFVHLTAAANAARVRRGGIRAVSRGRGTPTAAVPGPGAPAGSGPGAGPGGVRKGVYCFPVLPSYTLTHQWLRELARHGGPRGLVAVHLRLPDDEPVAVGRYTDRSGPVWTTAADAVRRVAELPDARGWEVFVPRAVTRREVHRVRAVRQVAGWRYFPGAHGVAPCTCAGCVVRGAYGSRRLRERRPHPWDGPPPPPRVLLRRIEAAADGTGGPATGTGPGSGGEAGAGAVPGGDAAALCDALHWYGMRRRGPVERLAPLAGHPDARVRAALAEAVGGWSTPGVDALLERLAADPDPDVAEAATDAAALRAPDPPG
ncbi:HEAT repeat domain-containing protein [Streptomyces sp. enrichment culture]|uniref:HEAT repeat domain-containing protein n=1 Tax=Streptomyces sp. enrichment culture TaxID=1795815 RepID=UPI003F57F8C3